MQTITALTILALIFTEAYCIAWICDYIRTRLRERELRRREYYRQKAYQELNERYRLYKTREELFNSISKES
ncbi:MAG TPA: hypothetical protein RWO09_03515 [Ruminococcus sp.]